jgi:N-acetylmuramoyl-L-alanine amidase
MTMLRSTRDLNTPKDAQTVLADMIWRTARDSSVREREAIAVVVMRRARDSSTPNLDKAVFEACRAIAPLTPQRSLAPVHGFENLAPIDERNKACCARIARRAVMGVLDDLTNGATHYHFESVCPAWSRGRMPCAWVGVRLFYKLEA